MLQATTPTFTMTLPSAVDLSDTAHVYFTIEQDGFSVTKNDDDEMTVLQNVVTVALEQADTVNFNWNKPARIQLNWTYSDGSRAGSKIKEIVVYENLIKDVIE